jgi:hypothetical protein
MGLEPRPDTPGEFRTPEKDIDRKGDAKKGKRSRGNTANAANRRATGVYGLKWITRTSLRIFGR